MKNYNFAPLSCWPSLNSGLDEFHSTNSGDISMMMGSNFNGYVEGGFNYDNSDQICYGTIDVPPQFPYLSPALHTPLMSTTSENVSIGGNANMVDYQWCYLPCETTKTDTPYVQSCKPTIKDVRKSVNGARLGQRHGGVSSTSVEASRVSKKKKDNIELLNAQKLKVTSRKSQKLSDKIAALQEIVSPYGKTDTASVLQEACLYIRICHQEIRVYILSFLQKFSYMFCTLN
ncbi:hypothetical protein RND81_03G102000 [Saponaria officinalis]|uniref:BHLH domain-containing protein n=1 Tax=Saponaria officinalis TaxID=3572 RepID=A0AAW1M7K0_SAPOF